MRITLKTLPEATAQQVFDQVAAHLLKQGVESMNMGRCLYKFNTLSCAAGCLIDESEYKGDFETLNWIALARRGWVPQEHQSLISALQGVHDRVVPSAWQRALRMVANDYGLNSSVLDQEKTTS